MRCQRPDGYTVKEAYHLQEVSLLHDTTPGLYKKYLVFTVKLSEKPPINAEKYRIKVL